METSKTYHIDVTPEEDLLYKDNNDCNNTENKKIKLPSKSAFLKIFCVVFGVHVAAAAIVGFGSLTAKAENVSEDKKFVGQDEPKALSEEMTNSAAQASPTPSPEPTPLKALATSSSKQDWPKPTAKPVVTQPPIPVVAQTPNETKKNEPKKQNNKLVSQYTVKHGDTIIGIAKRYKLNTKRLMQLNDITDPTKLKVGQVLKFM